MKRNKTKYNYFLFQIPAGIYIVHKYHSPSPFWDYFFYPNYQRRAWSGEAKFLLSIIECVLRCFLPHTHFFMIFINDIFILQRTTFVGIPWKESASRFPPDTRGSSSIPADKGSQVSGPWRISSA